jgi:hypothetical protein
MALNKDAKIVLREAGVTPAAWARANYMTSGVWSGDACGCPDDRCKDGFHHHPSDECGCLRSLLESYVSGEGQFDGESGYVIRDPLWAQVRRIRRRAGQHSGKPPSELCCVATALDEVLKLAHDWDGEAQTIRADAQGDLAAGYGVAGAVEVCAQKLRAAISRALFGEEAADG